VKETIMDGAVWQMIAAHNGKPFFDNTADRDNQDELRIGITLGFDGLGPFPTLN
jgi:hypothetical protein